MDLRIFAMKRNKRFEEKCKKQFFTKFKMAENLS